ncbi:MAG: RNA-binding cell elongation regulator Jag/EloR [Desulfobacteraceae bacterium]
MNFLEFEGKTAEEAIDHACGHFQVPQEQLEIEIISLGSSGIFGLIGGRKVKIRAALKPEEEKSLLPQALEILDQLLQKMNESCKVNGIQEDDQIKLYIEGEDPGLLIGKQGQTLEAIQYLVTKILAKQTKKKPRVVIDIESYRERHRQALIDMALKYGDKVKRVGKPLTLSPMNAHDRRIIHLTLQPDKELKTKSRGEGLYKKIIIYPAKKKGEQEAVAEAT